MNPITNEVLGPGSAIAIGTLVPGPGAAPTGCLRTVRES
jgi:hypothetical protein